MRIAGLDAIRQTENGKLANQAMEAVQDPEVTVVAAAMRALGNAHDIPGAVTLLIEGLDRGDEIKAGSLHSLGKIKPGHIRRYGERSEDWKLWWKLYQEQVGSIVRAEEALTQGNELFKEGSDESKKKAIALLREHKAALTALAKKPDRVPELSNTSPNFKRLEKVVRKLGEREHFYKKQSRF